MASSLLICLVDDSADFRYLAEEIFKRDFPHHNRCLYESGQALLEALPQLTQKPNLILLDQHMPQLDGYQTLLALKQHSTWRHIPVVLMSADASPSEIRRSFGAGANAFLTKPLDLAGIKTIIVEACSYASRPTN